MSDLFNLDDKKIKDIKNKEKISFYAKIDNINIQKTVNNSDFMNLTLLDNTGSINSKKWNIDENEKSKFKVGQLVFVVGVGNEYNNKLQFVIEKIRLVNENDSIDLKLFFKQAPITRDKLREGIYKYVQLIKNDNLKTITMYLLKKYDDKYFIYPAASKNHHAYISGLAYHVYTMLKLADGIKDNYQEVNSDLLYAGIILHDIGKVIELSDHLAPEYTKTGKLIGHINICFEEIKLASDELDICGEEILLLQHLVLSHHGLLEYGSPKVPMVLEAEILHLLDLVDSRINMITNEINQIEKNDFTKRIFPLEGRSFFKHNL